MGDEETNGYGGIGSGDSQYQSPFQLYRSDQTVRRDYMALAYGGLEYTDENGVENTPAGCSVIYSKTLIDDGTTNYDTGLKICNMLDYTRPLSIASIDKNMFPNRIEDTPKDNYVFLSVKETPTGKCYRYVNLNKDMTADSNEPPLFVGDCGDDIYLDHNTILNGEAFTNVKSSKKFKQRKSEEHFESNKNLKCKHRY